MYKILAKNSEGEFFFWLRSNEQSYRFSLSNDVEDHRCIFTLDEAKYWQVYLALCFVSSAGTFSIVEV